MILMSLKNAAYSRGRLIWLMSNNELLVIQFTFILQALVLHLYALNHLRDNYILYKVYKM